MDETSCQEVEEEEGGLCHTVYMEECKMKEVEEMTPAKVQVCMESVKEEMECSMVEEMKEVEEVRPICDVKNMDKAHRPCSSEDKTKCKKVMDCKPGKKMVKRPFQKKKCVRKKNECFDVVKLEKQMQERKSCSFHPKTVCHP